MNFTFGLTPEQHQLIKYILEDNLSKKNSYKIFVFGSRANGTERKYSDIDLWIESVTPLSQNDLIKITNDFDDSDLSIKVDIVTPETCLEEYISRIQAEKKLWFQKEVR